MSEYFFYLLKFPLILCSVERRDGRGAPWGGLPTVEDREQSVPGEDWWEEPRSASTQTHGWKYIAGPQLLQGNHPVELNL